MSPFDFVGKTNDELLQVLSAFQNAIDCNIICSIADLHGNIIHANEMFCEISKYSAGELLGKNHRILNSGYHPPGFFADMWLTITSGKTWHNEVRNKAKDGSYYWVDTVIVPIKDEDGKNHRYLSLRMPISERKHAEERKETYVRGLEEMMFMTSHKVRKPVVSCLGLMNILDSGEVLGEEEKNKILQHLKTSALELDRFTKELSEYVTEMDRNAKSSDSNYA